MGFFTTREAGWHSPNLNRTIGMLAYGGFGRPIILFPPAGQSAADVEQAGFIDALYEPINAGLFKLYVLDSPDAGSWLATHKALKARLQHQIAWDHALVEEVLAHVRHDCRSADIRPLLAGIGLGGFHAINTLGRYPAHFRGAATVSGRFDVRQFLPANASEQSGDLYFHNPITYLPNLDDAVFLPALQRRSLIHLSARPGEAAETENLAAILRQRSIPHILELHHEPDPQLLLDGLLSLEQGVAAAVA